MTRSSLLRYARSQIGYVERPVNRTKYGRQFGQDGIFWCMAFVWACFENSDNKGLVIKTASTRELYKAAKARQRNMTWLGPTATPMPGDLVEFDMGGPEPVNHIGIVERRLPDGRLVCIEGNTGGRGPGGERNGGMVARKIRDRHRVVNFVRPTFTGADVVQTPGPPSYPGQVIRRGASGRTVRQIQARLNTVAKGRHGVLGNKPLDVDGEFGPDTERVVKTFQQHRGLKVDGEVGPKTWAKLFG
jgi:Putative peptidoglycan binding domain/CHAP domain